MTRYRYLGYGVTDENGQATLDYDPEGNSIDGYTGEGLGLIDIVASTDDSTEISTESVQSDPIEIEDYVPIPTNLSLDNSLYYIQVGDTLNIQAILLDHYGIGMVNKTVTLVGENLIFNDKAVTGNKNTHWNDNGASVTTGASNTTVELDYNEYYQAEPLLVGDFEIQFNTSNFSGAIRIVLYNSTSKRCIVNINTNGIYKISRTNGIILIQKSVDNGESWTTLSGREIDTLTDENCYFRFVNTYNNTTRSFKYFDFKMTYNSKYTSTTNNNGVASFSIDDLLTSGKYTFEASYESLTAECEVINALFYDKGITGAKNTEWATNVPDYGSARVTDEGTVLSTTSADHGYNYFPNLPNTSSGSLANLEDWKDNIAVEFDIVSLQGNNSLFVVEDIRNISFKNMRLSSSESNVHIKLTFNNGVSECYVNNSQTSVSHKEYTSFINKFIHFQCRGGETFTFKEFVIYSLPYEPIYGLSFESDTIYGEVGDSIPINVNLKDQYGYGLENAQITLTCSNGSTYTSNTNSQGVASFSISDLSTDGIYSFTASYGSLTATCQVIVPVFFDKSTASWGKSTNATNTFSDGVRTIGLANGEMCRALVNGSAVGIAQRDFAVEFDYNETSGGNNLYQSFYIAMGSSWQWKGHGKYVNDIKGKHIKIEYLFSQSKLNFYVDGVLDTSASGTISSPTDTMGWRFQNNNTDSMTIEIKNFILYYTSSS